MAILKHVKRLRYIDYMIKKRATGDLQNFARKNGLCKSALAEVIAEMKALGFPIKYDRTRNTYYYEKDGEMVKCLFLSQGEILSKSDLSKIGKDDELCFSEVRIFELCKNP